MKHKAIIETDEFEDFGFFEDGNGKYLHAIDTGSVNGEWIALYFTECNQESILDKIRAEIEKLDGKYVIGDYGIYGENTPKYVHLWEVLQIIDKYKAEREE